MGDEAAASPTLPQTFLSIVTRMPRRLRTFLGTLAILAFVIAYALLAMALAESRIQNAPALVQTLAYFVLGIAWILPVFPLIRWMERPNKI